jgi:C-terminal processing protease CtpA/Prc
MKNLILYLPIILLLGLSSCEKTFFQEEPANNPEALFEELWQNFDQYYASFEQRNVDWNETYNTYRPLVNMETTNDELWNIFKSMLRSLDDGHVSLIRPDDKYYFSNLILDEKIDDELFDLDMIKHEYLNDDYTINGYDINTFGWLEGNIGYWHMFWTTDNFEYVDVILDKFDTADGLVIDFRHNGGGQMTYAFTNFGRFTQEERLTHRTKTINGPNKGDFSDWFEWTIKPKGKYFDKPIVLITDRYTISAAERILMAFKTLPNVTTLGETSSGGLSTKIVKQLQNGWYYSVCPQIVEYVDGNVYEGIGFAPDIPVKNTLEEVQNGTDRTLDKAMSQFN